LGDEAMLEANLLRFRQMVPDIRFTVLSRDPAWTGRHYDVESLAIPQGSSKTEGWGQSLGDEVSSSLRESSGLVISGGGNLCSTWPDKIHERVALMETAFDAGIPTVVLGQTLGPELTPDQRFLLANSFGRVDWLGVRDETSAALALDLGTPADRVHRQLDDAFFLDPLPAEEDRALPFCGGRRPWIIVTLDASFGSPERAKCVEVLASQLDALAQHIGAALVFVPHVGGAAVGDAHSDEVAGRALASHLNSKLVSIGLWPPREVRWLIGRAAMVVSTRYHALVFAAAAGVPALGIHTDHYSQTKLRGALAAAGLECWCLSATTAEKGQLLPLAAELWHRRRDVAERLASLRAEAWPRELQRWDAICRTLRLEPTGRPDAPQESPRLASPPRQPAGPRAITETQWRAYEDKGYLRLGRVLSGHDLAALSERLNAIMLGQVRYPTLEMQLDTGGAYEDLPNPVPGFPAATLAYRKIQGLEADPLILELFRRDVFREISARHYGRHASISIFRAMMMNKPAGKGTYLPWHQDAGDVWKLDRDPLVTIWIALDPATRRNGCVQVIPGSHHLGLLSKNGSTISPAHVDLYCPEERIDYLELEAGEGLLLHNWLLHRSDINRTNTPRRALSVCYMDGRTLNTLTGDRFPVIFGEHEEAESTLIFLAAMQAQIRQLRETATESERYAKSLLEHTRGREEMRLEAERYAESLLEENQRRESMRVEAECYAKSLEGELARYHRKVKPEREC
jgi:polysaccharide pyruvyl transferase WcaK-like protein